MPLKIKKKNLPLHSYCGVYDLSALFGSTCNSIMLTINNIQGSEVSLSISLYGVQSSQGTFDADGFLGKELKLALVNTVGAMYTSVSDAETPDDWASNVAGLGSKLFAGIEKLQEKIEPVTVGVDMAACEKTVAEAISEECGDSESSGLVVLSKATKAYQQVKGTDSSSRYVFIAKHDGMNMAMRILNEGSLTFVKVSVRVERVDGGIVHSADLELLGLNTTGKGHASCHFQCNSQEVLDRFFIFFAGCLPKWELSTMDVNKIKKLSS